MEGGPQGVPAGTPPIFAPIFESPIFVTNYTEDQVTEAMIRLTDASATKVPAASAFPAVVVTAASATASETNRRLRSIQRPTSTSGIQI